MAQEFLHYAHLLYEGQAGSTHQQQANIWLMHFQDSPQAWEICHSTLSGSWTTSSASQIRLLCIQILRRYIRLHWDESPLSKRSHMRQEFFNFITQLVRSKHPKYIERIACATMSCIIVRSALEWPTWKAELFALTQESRNVHLVLQVIALIPEEVQDLMRLPNMDNEKYHKICSRLTHSQVGVCEIVECLLSQSQPEDQIHALRCLHSWVDNSVEIENVEFSISLKILYSRGLLEKLFTLLQTQDRVITQTVADVLSDALAFEALSTHEDAQTPTPEMQQEVESVLKVAMFLVHCRPEFTLAINQLRNYKSTLDDGPILDLDEIEGEGTCILAGWMITLVSRIAERHSIIVWGPGWFASARKGVGCREDFESAYLALVLECTAAPILRIACPMFEFWYFALGLSSKFAQNPLCYCPGTATSASFCFDSAVRPLLQNVYSTLITHCELPQWYLESSPASSRAIELDDEFHQFREDIADTFLSMCSYGAQTNGLTSIVQQLIETTSIPTVEATLQILVRLTEVVEWDDEDEIEEIARKNDLAPWISVINRLPQLPNMLRIVLLEADLIFRMASWLHWNPNIFNQAFSFLISICDKVPAAAHAAGRAVLKMATMGKQHHINMGPFVPELLKIHDIHVSSAGPYRGPPSTALTHWYFLEALGLASSNYSDADSFALMDHLLSLYVNQMQQITSSVIAPMELVAVEMALSSVQIGIKSIQHHRVANELIVNVWPILSNNVMPHCGNESRIRQAVAKIINAMIAASNQDTLLVFPMVDVALNWYGDYAESGYFLDCLGQALRALYDKDTPDVNDAFGRFLQSTMIIFYQKLHVARDRAIEEMYDTLRLQSTQQHGVFKTCQEICSYIELQKQVLIERTCLMGYNCGPDAQDTLISVNLVLCTSFLSVKLSCMDTITSILKFLTASIRTLSKRNEQQLLLALRGVAVPLLRSLFWLMLETHMSSTVTISIGNTLFQLLHARDTASSVKEHFRGFVLTTVFQDPSFVMLLRCGEAQACHIGASFAASTSKHGFRSLYNQVLHFFRGTIEFKSLKLPLKMHQTQLHGSSIQLG